MRYLKVLSVELVPNGKEYQFKSNAIYDTAKIINVRARRKGFTLNDKAIAEAVFDSAMLKLKVNSTDVIDHLPLQTIEQIDKATGKGFELNGLKNVDWGSSMIIIQNGAAAVANTSIELVFEYEM
jgi:hypothetical protein